MHRLSLAAAAENSHNMLSSNETVRQTIDKSSIVVREGTRGLQRQTAVGMSDG